VAECTLAPRLRCRGRMVAATQSSDPATPMHRLAVAPTPSPISGAAFAGMAVRSMVGRIFTRHKRKLL
jgi:hypothetical protein